MPEAVERERRWAWLCIVLLLGLPFVLFWQLWWPVPELRLGFARGDFDEQVLPMRRFAVQEWRAGRLPLWDSFTMAGQPVVPSSVFETFYPLGFWQLLFAEPPRLALELEAVAHLGLAGVFVYLFVQELAGRRDAALLAGLVFSWGGLLTSWPPLHYLVLETMVWLPAGLWLLERGLQRRSLRWAVLAALPYGLSLLAGHGQTVLYSAYLSGAYLLWRSYRLRLPWRFVLRAAGSVGLLTLGIGAAQWLPAVEMARLSQRTGWSYADVAQGFQPSELLGLLRPNPEGWSPLYLGLLPLLLALTALLWRGRREAGFWWGVVLVALLLSLGGNAFLYPLAYRFLPGFSAFRHQERSAYLVSFGLAVLAALGYAGLTRRWPQLRQGFPLLFLLVAVDLYAANNGVILEREALAVSCAPTPAVEFLRAQLGEPARLNSEGLLPGGGNAGMVHRLRDVTGNNPLRLGGYDLLLERVPEVRWWQLFNVEYLVTRRELDFPGITLQADFPEEELRIYHLDLGGQAVWITHEAVVMPDQTEAIRATSALDIIDTATTAVLERAPVPAPEPAMGPERARITTFAPQRVAAEVLLRAPGVVVFSEVDYPGWVLIANGERVKTLRAFGLLRAVALPAGEWELEWRFRPVSVYVGLGLTVATVVGLLWAYKRVRI